MSTTKWVTGLAAGVVMSVVTGCGAEAEPIEHERTASVEGEAKRQTQDDLLIHGYAFRHCYYQARYPEIAGSTCAWMGSPTATNHWVNNGFNEGRQGSPVFLADYYLDRYEDLRAAFGNNKRAALQHFISNGAAEGRRASQEFDCGQYLEMNPDVRDAVGGSCVGAINHYLNWGIYEGRLGTWE